MHTARGARASIRDAGDNKIALGNQFINNVIGGWPGIDVLVDFKPIPKLIVLVHQFFDPLQQEAGIGLAVAEKSADLAVDGVQTRGWTPPRIGIRVNW